MGFCFESLSQNNPPTPPPPHKELFWNCQQIASWLFFLNLFCWYYTENWKGLRYEHCLFKTERWIAFAFNKLKQQTVQADSLYENDEQCDSASNSTIFAYCLNLAEIVYSLFFSFAHSQLFSPLLSNFTSYSFRFCSFFLWTVFYSINLQGCFSQKLFMPVKK